MTVVLFVKAFRFLQRDQPCERPPFFVRDARIGKLSLDDDQVRIVDEFFHRSHERIDPMSASLSLRDAIRCVCGRAPQQRSRKLGGSYGTVAKGVSGLG